MTPSSARACLQAPVPETPCRAGQPEPRGLCLAAGAALAALMLAGCSNMWPFKPLADDAATPPAATAAPAAPVTTAAIAPVSPPVPSPAPAAAAPQPEAMAQPVAPSPQPQPVALARPAPEPAPVMVSAPLAAAATLKRGAYYINVGLFMVPANGINAHQKLQAADLPVFSDTVQSVKKGPLTRVRVGPFASKAQADAAARKIKSLKLEAAVFRH